MKPKFPPGALVYLKFRGIVGAVLPYQPQLPALYQLLIVGSPKKGRIQVGDVDFFHLQSFEPFDPKHGAHLLGTFSW